MTSNEMTSNKMTASGLPSIAQALEQQILNINKNLMMTLVQKRKEWSPLTPEMEEELRRSADYQKSEVALIMCQHLRCPICQDFFIQPTSLPCSHVYCRLCIDTWRRTTPSCPCCCYDVTSCKSMVRFSNCLKRIFEELGGEFLYCRKLALDQRYRATLDFDGNGPQYLDMTLHNTVDRIVENGDRPQDSAVTVPNPMGRIVDNGDRPQDSAVTVPNTVTRIVDNGDRPQDSAVTVPNPMDRIVDNGDRPQESAVTVPNTVARIVDNGDRPQDSAVTVPNTVDRIVITSSWGCLGSMGASISHGGVSLLSSVGSFPKTAIKTTKSFLKTAKTGLAAQVSTLTNRVEALLQSGASPSDMLRRAASVLKQASLSGYSNLSKSKFLAMATELSNWAALQNSTHLTNTQLKQKASAMAKAILKAGSDSLSSAKAMKSSLVKTVKSVKMSVAKRAQAATAKTAHALAKSVTNVKDSVLRKAAACQRAVRSVQSSTNRTVKSTFSEFGRALSLGLEMSECLFLLCMRYRGAVG